MRVISGSARGKKLLCLAGNATRPTTDRVKESIFNIIASYVRDASALDLFAGSGALGIEALSRGAKKCTFVENSREAISVVQENIKGAKVSAATVVFMEACAFLEKTTETFDLIFLDPPYDADLYSAVLKRITMRGLLSAAGIIVVERRANAPVPTAEGLQIITDRKYGQTTISILKGCETYD